MITRPEQIQEAATFIRKYSDGWRDSWNGPPNGELNLYFFDGDRVLGGYGFTRSDTPEMLVSVGTLSRHVPTGETEELIRNLGIRWPLR